MAKTKPSLERILREYFACPKPVLKRPVLDEDGNMRFLSYCGFRAYKSLVSLLYDLETFLGPCTIAELQEKISSGKTDLFGMDMKSETIAHVLNAVFELVFGDAETIDAKPFHPDDIIETLDDIVAGCTEGLTMTNVG